jgi:hypothetical protein
MIAESAKRIRKSLSHLLAFAAAERLALFCKEGCGSRQHILAGLPGW